jgi:hypothetical protein
MALMSGSFDGQKLEIKENVFIAGEWLVQSKNMPVLKQFVAWLWRRRSMRD